MHLFSFLKKYRSPPPAPASKVFGPELNKFMSMLDVGANFALVRFGDGEMTVINGKPIDLSLKCNGEHRYVPGDVVYEEQRKRLRDSLRYQSATYFVGIACPCCVGKKNFFGLKQQSGQPESQLTWANLFVNSNYPRFRAMAIPLLARRDVILVGHRQSQPERLPFKVLHHFGVGPNAWINDYERCLDELIQFIEGGRVEGHVFLFAAGVLSNILIYELHRRFPNNTYLDVGSVFDVDLGLGVTRKYLRNSRRRMKKICVWM